MSWAVSISQINLMTFAFVRYRRLRFLPGDVDRPKLAMS